MPGKNSDTLTRGNRIAGLVLFLAAVLTCISIIFYHPFDWPAGGHQNEITNPLKQLGAFTAFILINFTFGRWGAFVFPIILFIWGLKLYIRNLKILPLIFKIVGLGIITGWLLYIVSKSIGNPLPEYYYGLISGGIVKTLEVFTGNVGTWIITAAVCLVYLEITIGLRSPTWLLGIIGTISSIFKRINQRRGEIQKIRPPKETREKPSKLEKPRKIKDKKRKKFKEKTDKTQEGKKDKQSTDDEDKSPSDTEEVYTFPNPELLKPSASGEDIPDAELKDAAASLEQRLSEFGVQARVVAIHPGPVITRFDLQPAPGVKVSRIVALQDDLSLSMRAKSIRIMAPIPGEAAVGVEVPNARIKTVRIREVVESDSYKNSDSKLTMALGVDTSGNPYTAKLNEMPHLLVAGTTGSGKSVCLNTILASILFRSTPQEVRLALIDPKKLELKMYVPLLEQHLITPPGVKEPVVTEPDGALKMLKSLELEMQMRYNKLSEKGNRSLEEYNHNRDITKLPYIVLVIDELADLMMTAGGAIETPIARLAQMGRAVGIHLIVATQRPSVDVITGLIKANFPCRIAFQVATKVDSRTIIDCNGAETLLGRGDMLFLPPGSSIPMRLHGSLITTEEIEHIVDHVSRQPGWEDMLELPDPLDEPQREISLSPASRDELFEEAARLVAVHQQGSVSLLQRKLKIGYARAARIIDQLEAAGIVGPFDGSKARKVMVDETWLPEMGFGGNED